MKTQLLVFMLSGAIASSFAQNKTNLTAKQLGGKEVVLDSLKTKGYTLPRIAIDITYNGGQLDQQLTMIDLSKSYANSLAFGRVVQQPKFTDGHFGSGNIQVAYFTGKNRCFGFGIGLMYSYQAGTLTMDSLHIEYERQTFLPYIDHSNGINYRQIISSASPITENIKTSSFIIPVMLKYRQQFKNSMIGFTIDAGGLFGLYNTSQYMPDTYFNYEAIYQTNDQHSTIVSGYNTDPHPNPGNALMYTSAKGQAQLDIDNMQGGYNVGLYKYAMPASKSVHYTKLSYGFMVRAAATFQIDYNTSFSLGAYYMYQQLSYGGDQHYHITDSVSHLTDLNVANYGNYNSMLNGITKASASSFGFSAGLRFFFGKFHNADEELVPDKTDQNTAMNVKPVVTNPDSDGDGILDTDDACPNEPGNATGHGCPDSDGDGFVDNQNDDCPNEYGTHGGCILEHSKDFINKLNNGKIVSLKSNGDAVTHYEVLQTTVLQIATNKDPIALDDYPKLSVALGTLLQNDSLVIYFNSNANNSSSSENEKKLYAKSINEIKKYMLSNGLAESRIITSGNDIAKPANPGNTDNDKAQNNRIEMKLLSPLKN